ncbi:MAG: fluoride efflux transporter CrcB [Terracidiphilus sp.]
MGEISIDRGWRFAWFDRPVLGRFHDLWPLRHEVPYGTFVINLTACVIIGFALTYLGRRADMNPAWRFLIPVGFVGAYSTFSTYEWETLSNLRSGAFLLAALYAVGSLLLGLIAVWGGLVLAEVLG